MSTSKTNKRFGGKGLEGIVIEDKSKTNPLLVDAEKRAAKAEQEKKK